MNDCKPSKIVKSLLSKVVRGGCGHSIANGDVEEGVVASTRDRILQSAFEEMFQHGYQGMRIDSILTATKLAKGALYHHFPNKLALGYAVIEEIILPHSRLMYQGLIDAEDPIEAHCDKLKDSVKAMSDEDVALGCPVNNLSQEMSGLDEGFKERLMVVYKEWAETISLSLKQGQDRGIVRMDIDTDMVAVFILSSLQGVMGTAKCMQSQTMLVALADILCDYLQSLRAPAAQ